MATWTLDGLARLIDHTYLKPFARDADMERLCAEARDHHFAMVAINQVQTALCRRLLEGTDIHVGAAISFPLGQTTIASKVFDSKDAIANGADEIDYVVNLTEVESVYAIGGNFRTPEVAEDWPEWYDSFAMTLSFA
ncbi:MAG: hypothetical protein IJG82_01040, partial [Atopobiaceae bacterium]|nr:hypothetical protein [Atopobiaceae bacterium]